MKHDGKGHKYSTGEERSFTYQVLEHSNTEKQRDQRKEKETFE